jgi:hypothetical protein
MQRTTITRKLGKNTKTTIERAHVLNTHHGETKDQGDQIGRIVAYCAILLLRQFLKVTVFMSCVLFSAETIMYSFWFKKVA